MEIGKNMKQFLAFSFIPAVMLLIGITMLAFTIGWSIFYVLGFIFGFIGFVIALVYGQVKLNEWADK